MSVRDVDGLNVGYAQGLLEQYLDNPEAVPEEWREFFESGDGGLAESLPALSCPSWHQFPCASSSGTLHRKAQPAGRWQGG